MLLDRVDEPTISIRLLWPFARLLGRDARAIDLLHSMQLTTADLAVDQGIPCSVAWRALERAIDVFGDPTLGLRAWTYVDQGTYGVLEHVAATTPTLRAALESMTKHLRVMNQAAELRLETPRPFTGVGGPFAGSARPLATLHYVPIVEHPAAANDLAIMSMLAFIQRHCDGKVPLREVWFAHSKPAYADAYAQYIPVLVRFDMPTSAIVMDAEALALPMRGANAAMADAFKQRAEALSSGLAERTTVSHRLRKRLSDQLNEGNVRMNGAARELRMSVATLRRKLEDEGTSFSEVLEALRQERARHMLTDSALTVTHISRALGFSHVRAFTRAFQRWTGKSPSEFRRDA